MERTCRVHGCERPVSSMEFCEMHYRRVLRTGEPGPPGKLTRARSCRIDGCDKPHDADGLCHGHYQRLIRTGSVGEAPLRKPGRLCSVPDCGRSQKARGYCAAHYKRVLIYGYPKAEEPIRRSDGTGHISHGYKQVSVPKDLRYLSNGATKMAEHRLVMALKVGRALRSDEQVHHMNGVRTDNRLENLELWSTAHPSGRRLEDLIEFCQAMLERYGDEFDLWMPEASS